jgi:lipid-A-disaccharide synthase
VTTVFVSAGDASGELHAAALVRALRGLVPEARFLGMGGAEMEKAGVELVVHQSELAVGALLGVVKDLGRIVSAWRRLGAALEESRPQLAVLVDSPDFHVPFARRARRAGARVLWYVAPQVWAWRRGRQRKVARRADRMAVIFPFEREVWAGSGLPVDFVGHPLVDRLAGFKERRPREALRDELGVAPGQRLVALLPGSRRNELRSGLGLQLEAARALHRLRPETRFALALAPSIPASFVEPLLGAAGLPAGFPLDVRAGSTYEVVAAADVALAKPGTITVEVALLGTPLVVAARADAFTAWLARRVLRVPSLVMPNLIAGEPVVPEFLQEQARPERIALALAELLEAPCAEWQRRRLADVAARLGGGGAARRAAAIAAEMLRG